MGNLGHGNRYGVVETCGWSVGVGEGSKREWREGKGVRKELVRTPWGREEKKER